MAAGKKSGKAKKGGPARRYKAEKSRRPAPGPSYGPPPSAPGVHDVADEAWPAEDAGDGMLPPLIDEDD